MGLGNVKKKIGVQNLPSLWGFAGGAETGRSLGGERAVWGKNVNNRHLCRFEIEIMETGLI
jgi:hypothetical protein